MNKSILMIDAAGPNDTGSGLALSVISDACADLCNDLGIQLDFRQTTDPEKLFRWIARDSEMFSGVVVNPAEFAGQGTESADTYRSALSVIAQQKKPIVEIHRDNIYHQSAGLIRLQHMPQGEMGFICGFGMNSFLAAIRAIELRLEARVRKQAAEREVTRKVFVLNGPNLNLLGRREVEIYGILTFDELAEQCTKTGVQYGIDVQFRQSNHEGDLVDWIQEAIYQTQGMIINAAAYTHTSVAIHDALRAYPGFKIELHISNPHLRETFRHISYVAPAVDGILAGLGDAGYELAIELMADTLNKRSVMDSA